MVKRTQPPFDECVITPLQLVGPLKFGMSRAQVIGHLGAPVGEVDDDIMEEIRITWPSVVCHFEPKSLRAVELRSPIRVQVGGVEIFSQKNVLTALAALDPTFEDGGGFANFPKLGVCLGGFGSRRIPEGKHVIAYGRRSADFYAGLPTA